MTNHNNPDALATAVLQDTPLLRTKLARALFCSSTHCDAALAEVIKFLTLASRCIDTQLTPSARVDVAWHEFILFTRTYELFCKQHFGYMIHHEPSDDKQKNSQQYFETLRRYHQSYGEPPDEFWGGFIRDAVNEPSAYCGNCEAQN